MTRIVPPSRCALARSWLLVPATGEDRLVVAARSSSDVVVLDIEDGVPPAAKDAARQLVAHWLSHRRAWVRINSTSSPAWHDDVRALRDVDGVEGIMLAKSESSDDIVATTRAIGRSVSIVAMIESAQGLAHTAAIASAPGVTRLAFGRGDFRRDTGVSDTPTALAFARSQMVLASRVAGIAGPVDGPCLSTDPDAVRADTAVTAEMGMTGKLCLHEQQAPMVNSVLSPTAEEVRWAEDTVHRIRIGGLQNGSDVPALGRAERILEITDALAGFGWE